MRPRRLVPALGVVFVALSCLAPGRAAALEDDPVERAKAAYAAAAVAYDRHDFATAAEGFARADELSPNERALHLALASAFSAPAPPLAMNLVERVEARARAKEPARRVGATVQGLARTARRRFASSLGRVRVGCPAGASCDATVDGAAVPVQAPTAASGASVTSGTWVLPGERLVVLRVQPAPDGSGEGAVPPLVAERRVRVEAGSVVDVAVAASAGGPLEARASVPAAEGDARAPGAPAAPPAASGLPAWMFWSGVGLSAGGAAVSTVLTAVLVGKHADFVDAPSAQAAAAGDAAQARARVAWAVTGGLVAATTVVALFTDFGGRRGLASTAPSTATAPAASRSARIAFGVGGVSIDGWFP